MNRGLARLRREVSRSFDLSMALLPAPMREPVSVAYLLARASDTLADTAAMPVARRLEALDRFDAAVRKGGSAGEMRDFIKVLDHEGEARLLGETNACLQSQRELPAEQRELVAEVLEVIISGQRLDLERASAGFFRPLDEPELDDYCWRVAGCVGRFWTRIGFATLGSRFSDEDPDRLEQLGISYGKGLQLVNILRDAPRDRESGRIYLAFETMEELERTSAVWRDRAFAAMGDGERYATALRSPRLRAASVLPALIGRETLLKLEAGGREAWARGVKVGRPVVRRCLARAVFW
ncbi:squalene/phytoene synthase family protein [Haloferula sargassicola]|uniref:15-cis-phytoene synthase n=1 Tax=Haloferula sargassicola TaxID=490096 RepID=A0ABP9UTT6_9BACT